MDMAGKIIVVKVKAGAKSREISVGPDGQYKIKTPRPPANNQANEDVVAILAEHFDVPKSRIELLSGQTFNLKKFRVNI